MFVEFAVENYRSFKDEAIFSMVSENIHEHEFTHTFDCHRYKLLRSSSIYGANASGKSNLLQAISALKIMISSGEIEYDPFLLNVHTRNEPSKFRITLIDKDAEPTREYIYSLTVIKDKVTFEKLEYREKRIGYIFERTSDSIKFNSNFKFKQKTFFEKNDILRDDTLLLTKLNEFNVEFAETLCQLIRNVKVVNKFSKNFGRRYTINRIENEEEFGKRIVELLNYIDICIQDIKVKTTKIDSDNVNPNMLEKIILKKENGQFEPHIPDIKSKHAVYDNGQKVEDIWFDFDDKESLGTQILFSILGPILDVLENGYTLIVDELSSNIHPLVTEAIIGLFNDPITNPNNAQLIFTTHNTNMMNFRIFRRDQIWFTDKNGSEETELYSLADFDTSTIRKEQRYDIEYLKGKFDAVPDINQEKLL